MGKEIEEVRELGERIGYGHLMSLASSLWRKNCLEKGYPIWGAFVPTCIPFVKDEHKQMTEDSAKNYDKIVSDENVVYTDIGVGVGPRKIN